MNLPEYCKEIANSSRFQSLILGLITMTAIVMGLETSEWIVDNYATWFDVFFILVQTIFCIEILIRILAYAPNCGKFFDNSWNRFDFAVVGISLIPAAGPFALIARFARLIRVARIVSSSGHLKDFIAKIADSVDIMLQASMVAAVFYYIFAVSGFYLFAAADPDRWGGLGVSLLTLVKLALFQDWVDIAAASHGGIYAWIYIIIFVALNIALFANFIAATTVDHFYDSTRRANAQAKGETDLISELQEIKERLERVQSEIIRRNSKS